MNLGWKVAAWLFRWNSPPADLLKAIDELLADPAERLSRGPVEIPRIRVGRPLATYALVAVVTTGVLIVEWGRGGMDPRLFLFLTIYALLVIAVVQIKEVRQLRMRLDRHGVTIVDRKGTIVCPWSLFNTNGTRAKGHVPYEIQFAVNAQFIPMVKMTRADGSEVEGASVANVFFRFGKHGSVHLSSFFAIPPTDVVDLLLIAGRAIGSTPGVDRHPISATRERPEPLKNTIDDWDPPVVQPPCPGNAQVTRRGWLTVSIVHWRFPAVCCVCGTEADSVYPVTAICRYLGIFHGQVHYNTVVPCCPRCCQSIKLRERLGDATIFVMSFLISMAGWSWILGPRVFIKHILDLHFETWFVWFLFAMMPLGALFRFGPELFSPVRARYRPRAEMIAFWFRRPGFAQLVLEAIKNSDAGTAHHPDVGRD